MPRRYLGGIFGNTISSTTNAVNLSGVFSTSQQNYMRSEGGWTIPAGYYQNNPALTPASLLADGITTNGYYWLKGTSGNSNANAKLFYCFLDSSSPLGAGWAIIAHHDGAKTSNSSHQPRPTANTNYVGRDNAAGNGNVSGDPSATDMVTSKSFSCNANGIPFTKFAHCAYGGGNWNQVEAYYGGTWNSAQTIPTTQAWSLQFDTGGVTFNGRSRRVYEGSNGYGYACQGVGVWNNNSGNVPKIVGNNSNSADYPVYVGVWAYNSANGGSAGFSWHDSSSSSTNTNDPHGWDDFQDGTGMGDNWSVEGESSNYARGLPSYIIIG